MSTRYDHEKWECFNSERNAWKNHTNSFINNLIEDYDSGLKDLMEAIPHGRTEIKGQKVEDILNRMCHAALVAELIREDLAVLLANLTAQLEAYVTLTDKLTKELKNAERFKQQLIKRFGQSTSRDEGCA